MCVCVLCVCGVLGRAEDDDEGAQFPFVTLAREFEKNPSSLIILQLLSSLFELKLITRRFDIGKKQSTLDLPKNHNLKRLLLRGPILSSEFAL